MKRNFLLLCTLFGLLVGTNACKSSRKTTSPASSDTADASASGGSSSTSGKKNNKTPAEVNTRVGQLLDQMAGEIKSSLKDVDVTRTADGILVTFDPEVSFNTNSSELLPQAQLNIEKLAVTLVKYPNTSVLVTGHADSTGRQDLNQTLSEKRAASFTNYLANKGIATERLTSLGMGATQPKASNKTKRGRKANRRIDAVIKANEAWFRKIAEEE